MINKLLAVAMRPFCKFLLIVPLLLWLPNAFAETLTLCVEDQHFAPFLIGTQFRDNQPRGYIIDLAAEAGRQAGIDVNFVRKPWKRCQQEVKLGKVDGLFAIIYTPERAHWAVFPMTDGRPDDRYMYLSSYRIFTPLESSLHWQDGTLMPADAVVQSVPGYIAEQKLIELGFNPAVNLQPAEALPLVAANRLDGYVVDEVIGRNLAAQMAISDQLAMVPEPFLVQHWYIAFAKQTYNTSAATIERFWTALALVREQQGQAMLAAYEVQR